MTGSENPISPAQAPTRVIKSIQGNVLVYLVVVVLIFGILGVTIVSLFTSATSSSATPNNARRAVYVTESAMHYAFSELRGSGFDPAVVNTLNTTTYNVDSGGSFTVNILAPWYVAPGTYSEAGSGALTLNVPAGKLTADWMAKNPHDLRVYNYDYLDENYRKARSVIDSWTKIDDTTLTLQLRNQFAINAGERLCFAVRPTHNQTDIPAGGDLLVNEFVREFFPEYNGVISIDRIDYVYEQLIHESANNRVRLKNLSAAGLPNVESAFPLTVTTTYGTGTSLIGEYQGDHIILSPRNYIVIPAGTAGSVSREGTLERALSIYDAATVKPLTRLPDIDWDQYNLATDLNATGTTGFITVDNDGKTVDIGSGLDSGKVDFGGIWFDADATIGGKTGACSDGACDFGRGVRVFFTLDYSGTGDGLTFALISAANNTTASIGGDIEMGELLGYGGDSRKVVNPTSASDFLDAAGAGENPPNPGLHPPKMALEFDVYNNNTYQAYCNSGTIVDNNRNDPLSGNKDALQYVFWGYTSLAMPCRNYTIGSTTVVDHPSYDDNRHDSGEQEQKWVYAEFWDAIRTIPDLSNDGSTVYVGSDDGWVYGVDVKDGTTKWWFDTEGKVRSSPVVDPNSGMVYVGSDGKAGHGRVYGFNPTDRLNQPYGNTLNTANEWLFYTPKNIDSSPAVGPDGTVYIGDEDGNFFALDPASRLADPLGDKDSLNPSKEWLFTDTGLKETSPGRPAIGPALDVDPLGNRYRIYITGRDAGDHTLFALDPADRLAGETFPGPHEWSYDTQDTNYFMPAADPVTGVVYVEEGNQIRALNPAGTSKWVASIGTNRFTPVIGDDGIIYVGGLIVNDSGKVTTLNSTTGTIIWEFTDSGNLADVRTTPDIGPDGTIYFGSGDGLLYAVTPDGSKKWTFPIPVDNDDNAGHSSPKVGQDGVVYIGSSYNDKFYAVNNFAIPRNIRNRYLTISTEGTTDTVGGDEVTVDDTISWLNGALTAGPWAVRLEVMRSLSQNANSKYEYELRGWLRQCTSGTCANVLGTFYEDTRIQYSATPHLAQTIELPQSQHDDFATFIFGFTGATGQGTSQTAVISDVKLSFIRYNDPIAP